MAVTASAEAAFTLATRGQHRTESEGQVEDTCLI